MRSRTPAAPMTCSAFMSNMRCGAKVIGPYLRKQTKLTQRYMSQERMLRCRCCCATMKVYTLGSSILASFQTGAATAHDSPFKAVDRHKKALDIGRKTWNAESETMFDEEKRTWKDSAHDRRCVIRWKASISSTSRVKTGIRSSSRLRL